MRIESSDIHYSAQAQADLVRQEPDLIERALLARKLRAASDTALEAVYMESVYRLRQQGWPIVTIASALAADPKWIRERSNEWAKARGLPMVPVKMGRPVNNPAPTAHRER